VIADIVGALVFTLGAYKIQPFRPAFSLLKVSEQWLFPKWLLGKSILGDLQSQIDTVLVAKFFTSTQLGNYHMARDVALLPIYNILGSAIERLLADLKDYKNNLTKLGHRVSKVLCMVSFIVVPLKCIRIVGALILSAVMPSISIVFTEWLTTQTELGQISLFLLSGTLFCCDYAIVIFMVLPRLMGTTVGNLLANYRQTKGNA
jgi:lipopolysaccharide exporter